MDTAVLRADNGVEGLSNGLRYLVARIAEVIVMTGRSSTAIALGAIGALVGVVLIFSGMGPMGEYRDPDGYYMSDPFIVERPSRAVVSDDIDLLRGRYETLAEGSVVLGFADEPDDVRVQGIAPGSNALFLGIAPAAAADDYLDGVAHDAITDWNADLAAINEVEYTPHQGAAIPSPPGMEAFWETSVAGPGPQTLDWAIESGDWTLVVMNDDASAGITAELAFGAAPSTDIQAIARTSLAIGAAAVLFGGLLLYVGVSGRDE